MCSVSAEADNNAGTHARVSSGESRDARQVDGPRSAVERTRRAEVCGRDEIDRLALGANAMVYDLVDTTTRAREAVAAHPCRSATPASCSREAGRSAS